MSSTLSRKQQKAQAFKSKQKAKRSGKGDTDQPDVPEVDLDDEQEPAIAESSSSKKRKRLDTNEATSEAVKGKGKAAVEEDKAEKPVKKSKKEVKQRFILFVGNMSYKTTVAEIQSHFKPTLGRQPSVRLLTTKATKDKPSQSRGIAFVELLTSEELQTCLKMHHSSLGGRRINVELTAGGGGNSTDRKEKLKSVNERIGGQRERKAEREKEKATAGEEAGGVEGGDKEAELKPWGDADSGSSKRTPTKGSKGPAKVQEADGEVAEGADGNVRMRGGRRVKVKAKEPAVRGPALAGRGELMRRQPVSAQKSARPQDGSDRALSGWQRRADGQSPAGRSGPSGRGGAMVRPKGRRPFALTGANAFSVS